MDSVAQFVNKHCLRHEKYRTRPQQLYDHYHQTCGEDLVNIREFKKRMEPLGIKQGKTNGNYYYRGVMIRANVVGDAVIAQEFAGSSIPL